MNKKQVQYLAPHNGGLVVDLPRGRSAVAVEGYDGYVITLFGEDETGPVSRSTFKTLEELERAMNDIAPLREWKPNK